MHRGRLLICTSRGVSLQLHQSGNISASRALGVPAQGLESPHGLSMTRISKNKFPNIRNLRTFERLEPPDLVSGALYSLNLGKDEGQVDAEDPHGFMTVDHDCLCPSR